MGVVLTPPVTKKRPITREHHGDVFVDDYEWLREKDDPPEVIAHLHEENAYTKARTEHLTMLTEQVFEEIKARTKETDLSVPTREGDWWYFSRTAEGSEYGIHCRVPAASADDWEPPVLPEPVELPRACRRERRQRIRARFDKLSEPSRRAP